MSEDDVKDAAQDSTDDGGNKDDAPKDDDKGLDKTGDDDATKDTSGDDGDKGDDKGDKADKADKAADDSKAPESYDLKLPEDSLLDPSDVERISSYAKEKGLSTEAAQELLTREEEAVGRYHEGQIEHVEKVRAEWIKEAEADPEIGGDDFNQNSELARRVVARFGTEEFKELVNSTGFGNHKELVRFCVRIGKLMSDDQLVPAKPQSGGKEKSAQDVLYDNTPKQEATGT